MIIIYMQICILDYNYLHSYRQTEWNVICLSFKNLKLQEKLFEMRLDSVPHHHGSHGKIFWQWGNSDHCFKPILKSVCSNCHVRKELLSALWLSLQYTVDERDNKEQEKERKEQKKESKTLVHRQFVNFLCIAVTACPAFINQFVCVPVMYSTVPRHSRPYPHSCLYIS